jgi:hypothetical protein
MPTRKEPKGPLLTGMLRWSQKRRLQYSLVGRVENNVAGRYPDFTPSLTRDDVYGIVDADTNASAQKAINALIERRCPTRRAPAPLGTGPNRDVPMHLGIPVSGYPLRTVRVSAAAVQRHVFLS